MNEKWTINFSVYESPKPDKDSATVYHVRQANAKHIIGTDDIAKYIESNTSFKHADVVGLLKALQDDIVEHLLNGRKVRLEGLGTFYLQLGLKSDKDAGGRRHRRKFDSADDITGNDVIVEGIGFKADRTFSRRVQSNVSMRRTDQLAGHSRTVSRAELLVGLDKFVRENGYITCRDFQYLFGVTPYKAHRMLTDLVSEPYPKYYRTKVGAGYVYKKTGDKI